MSSKHSVIYSYDISLRQIEFFEVVRRKLQTLGFELFSFEEVFDNHALRDRVTGIVTSYHETTKVNKVLPLLPNLKTISFMTAGFEGLDLEKCLQRNVTVGNVSLALKNIVADFSLALILASARSLLPGVAVARNGRQDFTKIPNGLLVTGATLGIVGMGQIGYEAAKRAHMGFRMTILYHSRNRRSPEDEACIQATYYATIHSMLPHCDIVLLTCSLNKTTHHMFGVKEFKLMKNTAIIVNVARGPLINHEDLVNALESGDVARAALDVTEPEPLPKEHPLLHMPNVVITPHEASYSIESEKTVTDVTIDNLLRGLEDKTMVCQVDLQSLTMNS